MLSRQRRKALLLAILAYATSTAQAFQSTRSCCNGRSRALTPTITTAITSTATVDADVSDVADADAVDADVADADVADADVAVKKVGKPSASGACYYKRADGPWKPRKELGKLKVGQRLFATRLTSSDLMNGKTGPKVFLECGIGRISDKGQWSIINGMMRLGRKGMKSSVIRKKKKQMPPNELIEVYVSKIRLDHGSFEVCLTKDEALDKAQQQQQEQARVSASTLEVGDVLDGSVRQVTPYGVFVDVNANRNGLLHISKVATYQNKYVDKEEGLKKIGLGRGVGVRVVVVSNEKKRLELDLVPPEPEVEEATDTTDEESENVTDDEADMWAAYAAPEGDSGADEKGLSSDVVDDEAAMWAAYAAPGADYDEDEDDEDDEDADIEDSLGIGNW